MKYIITILFILAILFLQTGILPNLKILNIYPNLILLCIIGLSILRGIKNSLIWIIIAGLFLDFYSLHNILGISIVLLLLTCILSQFLSRRFFKKENKFSVILISILSVIFYELLLFLIFKIFGMESNFYLLGLIIKIIYSSIFILPIFYLIKWYVNKLEQIQNQT